MMDHPELAAGRRRAREECAVAGREVVTPAAAMALFRRSQPAVRAAAREGRIETVFVFRLVEKEVRMYSLTSCTAAWGAPDQQTLTNMREDGHLMHVEEHSATWAVLHTERVRDVLTVAE